MRTTFRQGKLLLGRLHRRGGSGPDRSILTHLREGVSCCSQTLHGLHHKRAFFLGTSSLIGISVLAPRCVQGLCRNALRLRRFYGSILNVQPNLQHSIHFCMLFKRERGCCSKDPKKRPTRGDQRLHCLQRSRPLSNNVSFNGVLSFIVKRRSKTCCQYRGGFFRVPPK